MIDWTVIASTFIGTVAGAVIAAVITFFLVRSTEPKPRWHVTKAKWAGNGFKQGFEVQRVEISNSGNAPAYDLSATIVGAELEGDTPMFVPVLQPGESCAVKFFVPTEGDYNLETGIDSTIRSWPELLSVSLSWRQEPRMKREHTAQMIVDHS